MIILRELQEKDAPFMLEWMHDPDIQKNFKRNMLKATMEDVLYFIKESEITEPLRMGQSIHFAITNVDDVYLGTVSLKCIDIENGTAEYAIVTRKAFRGMGVAHEATELILKKAFTEFGLHRVYLSVYSNNADAIKLYEGSGFRYEGEFREHFLINGEYVNWKWYGVLREEFNEIK